MKYFIESKSGRTFEVEIENLEGEAMSVLIDGREVSSDFLAVDQRGQYAAILDWRSFAASIEESDEQHLSVNIAGEHFHLSVFDEREKAAHAISSQSSSKEELVKASMPGLIVSLDVKVGDVVVPNQPLVVLEAMKMQNEVCATHGGEVVELFVVEGENVEAKSPLVRIVPCAEE